MITKAQITQRAGRDGVPAQTVELISFRNTDILACNPCLL